MVARGYREDTGTRRERDARSISAETAKVHQETGTGGAVFFNGTGFGFHTVSFPVRFDAWTELCALMAVCTCIGHWVELGM